MPLLAATDPLPYRPRRIIVGGCSGAGKSTLAGRLSASLNLPYVELDSLYHGPRWTPRPEFEHDVAQFVAGEDWVLEYQYDAVRPLLATRADLAVWLDLPRPVVVRRVVRRTVARRWRRQVLWNGNQEPPLRTIITDPDHIVRYAWRTHRRAGDRVRVLADERPELPVVRLRNARDVGVWLNGPVAVAAGHPERR